VNLINIKILWRSWGITLVLLGGAALSILGFLDLQKDEDENVCSTFTREMDNRYESLDRELYLHTEFLLGLKGLFDASDHVSRLELYKAKDDGRNRVVALEPGE